MIGAISVACVLRPAVAVPSALDSDRDLVWMAPVHGGRDLERKKGIRWMPWHQEAMKDVARCEKPRGAASRR